ncbi:MAG: hypothetical protein ACE14V_01340 [bacterium]
MAYIKNETWTAITPITLSKLDNLETQFDEGYDYYLNHDHLTDYYTKTQMNTTFWYASNDGSGSGSDADLIYHADGNMHASDFGGLGIPTGLIIMWSGVSAPSGWHLCDGDSGTRNLRDLFVICAGTGSGFAVGDTDTGLHTPTGTISIAGHALTTEEVAGHQHTYGDKYAGGGNTGYAIEGTGYRYTTGTSTDSDTTGYSSAGKNPADEHSHEATFTGNEFTALPPYYALAYIQKTA